jgi:hypothetical protein
MGWKIIREFNTALLYMEGVNAPSIGFPKLQTALCDGFAIFNIQDGNNLQSRPWITRCVRYAFTVTVEPEIVAA